MMGGAGMWCTRYGKEKGMRVSKEMCFAWQVRYGCRRKGCKFKLKKPEVQRMRQMLMVKQQALDLLRSVGGVVQEAVVLTKVDKDKLAERCGELIAITSEVASLNGVDYRQLVFAVRKAKRRLGYATQSEEADKES